MAQSIRRTKEDKDLLQLPGGDLWRPNYRTSAEGNVDLKEDYRPTDYKLKLRQLLTKAKQPDGTYTCPWDGTTHANSAELKAHVEKHFASRLASDDVQEREAVQSMARRTGGSTS
jgi:hypothetical protein